MCGRSTLFVILGGGRGGGGSSSQWTFEAVLCHTQNTRQKKKKGLNKTATEESMLALTAYLYRNCRNINETFRRMLLTVSPQGPRGLLMAAYAGPRSLISLSVSLSVCLSVCLSLQTATHHI